MSITKRRAAVASGALLALAGALFTSTAAHADATGVTLVPAEQQNVIPASSDQTKHPFTLQPVPGTPTVNVTDTAGNVALWPHWVITGAFPPAPVWPTDPHLGSATTNATSQFVYDPTTKKLFGNVGVDGAVMPATNQTYTSTAGTVNPDKYIAAIRTLTPGQTFDWIVSLPQRNPDGSLGDYTTIGANDPYYLLPLEYYGKNPTTGNFEVSTVNDPNFTVHENVKTDTTTTVSATANADGSVSLQATVAPASASGTVTFSAPGVANVTIPVAGGTASTTITHNAGLPYDADVTFTASYSGDSDNNASSGTATAHTSAQPSNQGQVGIPETVTIAVTDNGSLTLSVADGGIDFGSATENLDAGTFTASAPLPTTTVTDNRIAKGDWTLNASSTDLKTADSAHLISADQLSWAEPSVSTPDNSGAVTGGPAQGLSADKPLATFADGGLLGAVVSTVDTNLSLTTPITQAQGDYAGTLTVTLI